MASRLRSTLRGRWWTAQISAVKHCYFCGGKLRKKYVPLEKKRRLVCVRCAQITYLNPKVVAGLIPVTEKGEVILLQREIEPAKGKWSFPAGYQEMGESTLQAALRETWEEIRVRIKKASPLAVYSYPDAGVVTIMYVARVPRKEKPAPGEESQTVALFSPEKIPWSKLAFRSTVQALRDWTKMVKSKS